MTKLPLRTNLTFGFEMTFSIERWWESPGFCSECDTSEKTELMRTMSQDLAKRMGMRATQFKDHDAMDAFQVVDEQNREVVKFSFEPGSIEVNTPPVLLKEVKTLTNHLLESAKASGLVTYRSWWYGIKTGTGGGCHLNMAGFTDATNPFHEDLGLVLKYFVYFHNRPALHYPFMGIDVGHGGNCMRIDEQGAQTTANFNRFAEAIEKYNLGWRPEGAELYDFFKDQPLATVKHSSPTLRKMRAPFFLVEDRAVEMARSSDEFEMLCELRMRILEQLQNEMKAETPKNFGEDLHRQLISYESLWSEFKKIAETLSLDSNPFEVFFSRQFPKLEMGNQVPTHFYVREGRRERKVLGAEDVKGEIVFTKKIDSRFKRVEVHALSPGGYFRINGKRMKAHPEGVILDLFVPAPGTTDLMPILDIEYLNAEEEFLGRSVLNLNSMLFEFISPERIWTFSESRHEIYQNLETMENFTLR